MQRPRHPMPDDVEAALRQRGVTGVYRDRPPYQQNDYVGWINRARKPGTRQKRIDQMLDELEAGGVYMKMKWSGEGAEAGDLSASPRRDIEAAPSPPALKTMAEPNGEDADDVARARIISTALPYMLRYDTKTVVVKYGGSTMGSPDLARAFARDITLLETSGVYPVVVHGGGPQIGQMLDRLGIQSEFRGGLRVTDRATVEVVEMVLAGSINKEIVMAINAEGGKAVGLSGKDGNMVFAEKLTRTERDPDSNIERLVDLGFVGEPSTVNRTVIDMVLKAGLIPVIAPVAPGRDGETYNVNADTFAGAIAGALGAARLLFLTDVPGVLDRDRKLIKALTVAEARGLIADGTISGGMIPKVETCIEALGRGVEGVVIVNGKTPHAVLLELFSEAGAGTLITP